VKREDINQQAFFELLRTGLWGNGNPDIRIDGATDWQEVYQLAQEQSVQGLVLQGIDWFKVQGSWTSQAAKPSAKFNIPQVLLLQWIGEVQVIEQRNKDMNAFIADLIEKLRKNDIYALLVKGQGIAQCYEEPLWRCSGDVDLLLSYDNYQKAKTLLTPLASEVETEYEGISHLGMTIDGWVVELHGSLRVGLSNRINHELDEIYTDTFNNGSVRSWNNNGTQIFTLSKENDIVYVFVHFFNHFYKEGVGLRQICDWCRLMWTYRDKIDLEKLKSRLKKAGIMSEWKAFYALASKYLGMPDFGSWLMVHDSGFDKKADRIMEFVLKAGNMGHKRGSGFMVKGSWLGRQYVVRKAFSMFRRIGDLINHARIFPLDSLRFFPRIMFNGVRSAMRGE
jgi:hypothetical protein